MPTTFWNAEWEARAYKAMEVVSSTTTWAWHYKIQSDKTYFDLGDPQLCTLAASMARCMWVNDINGKAGRK